MIGFATAAGAATLDVPGAFPTIGDALAAAAAGDTISVAAGWYAEDLTVDRRVTIRGEDPLTTTLAPRNPVEVLGTGDLTFASIGLDGGGGTVVHVADGELHADAVRIAWYGGLPKSEQGQPGFAAILADGGSVDLADSWFDANPTGGRALYGIGAAVTLDRVTIADAVPDGWLVEVVGGSLDATDLVLVGNDGDGLVRTVGADHVSMVRVLAACNTVVEPVLDLDAFTVNVGPLSLSGTLHGTDVVSDWLVSLTGVATLRHAVVVGDGTDSGVTHAGSLEVTASAFVDLATSVSAGGLSGGYDAFEGLPVPVGLGLGVVLGDPGLVAVGPPCGEVLVAGIGSAAVDAGSPAEDDRDGTRADIGAAGGPDGFVVDVDLDGAMSDVDCADLDAGRFPGADEVPYDGVDQDCDGADLDDVDGDGFALGDDCADGDPAVHPDATDVPYDGIDQDCVGGDLVDVDADGWPVNVDCDDADAMSWPGALEQPYDGVDQDCDGGDLDDVDGDGWPLGPDCDDADARAYPGGVEVPYDGVDQDCLDGDLDDMDGDGSARGPDCDDADPTVHPGAPEEWYDGVDRDCGGGSDYDADRDGFDRGPDCRDGDPRIHPGAVEDAGPEDLDCDGFPGAVTPFEPRGCSVVPGSAGGLGLLVVLLVLQTRRRTTAKTPRSAEDGSAG